MCINVHTTLRVQLHVIKEVFFYTIRNTAQQMLQRQEAKDIRGGIWQSPKQAGPGRITSATSDRATTQLLLKGLYNIMICKYLKPLINTQTLGSEKNCFHIKLYDFLQTKGYHIKSSVLFIIFIHTNVAARTHRR